MMICKLSCVVGKMSLREVSGLPSTSMPASFSRGKVSSKMRPLESAKVRGCGVRFGCVMLTQALYLGACGSKLGFHVLITTIQMVDALDGGVALGRQASDDQAGRGPQISGHDGGAIERLYPSNACSMTLGFDVRSEEHTSELQSRGHLVCRLLLEK